ncbi:MAG: hypothetical protein MK200_08070 [Nitrosopumilus sp.]|nr:hypothetical protein [Nitrosopumilus sp.]
MAIVRQAKFSGLTFGEFATQLLKTVLAVDVMFDTYQEQSIKNAERIRRSSNQLLFKKIIASNVIKQWNQFLSNGHNKGELVKFLAEQWTHNESISLIGEKDVYVTSEDRCILLSLPSSPEISELMCSQEEADTRLLLHAQHASSHYNDVIIYTPDTDVFVIALAFKHSISANLYIKTGVKKAKRLISLNAVTNYAFGSIFCKVQCDETVFLESLVGLHCFTGCDTVSAFSGKGKAKPLNLMKNHLEYILLFQALGQSWTISEDLVKGLEKFVCHLYGSKTNDVNKLRYKMYCSRKAELSCELLPPCFSSLNQHILRANYQTKIWRSSLIPNPAVPSPEGHGWYLNENNELAIKWMDCRPAPDEILELVTCDCKKKCVDISCVCMQFGFCCTDACSLTNCSNSSNERVEIYNHNVNLEDCNEDEDSDIDEDDEENAIF